VDSCHLPLRTRGGTYYRAKLNSSSPIHNRRQEVISGKTTPPSPEPGLTTKVTVEKDQSDHSPPLERTTEGHLETTSTSSPIPDFPKIWSLGISPCPLPPITVLINNLSLEGNDWTKALKILSLNTVSLNCPAARQDRSLDPPLLEAPPPPKRLCILEENSSSSSQSLESSSTRYFLRSQTKAAGGLGKEEVSSLDRGGWGRKSFLSKAQSKARLDLLAGTQQSIERALRAVKPQSKVSL
jgi:hypothetical protein